MHRVGCLSVRSRGRWRSCSCWHSMPSAAFSAVSMLLLYLSSETARCCSSTVCLELVELCAHNRKVFAIMSALEAGKA